MSVRNFKIINSDNEVIDLLNEDTFGYNPSGLGVGFENNYYSNNANFINLNETIRQNQFSINIIFGALSKQPYKAYNEFIRKINKTPLIFQYSIPNLGTLERQCQFVELPKGEINELNVIDEVFIIEFLSPWYQWINLKKDYTGFLENTGKIYNYVYDFIYLQDGSNVLNFFNIENNSIYLNSSTTSPIEIKITAASTPITNPGWRIIQNGVEIQNDRYLLTIPIGYTLFVSSEPQNQTAELISERGEKTNIYLNQDYLKTNFVTAPIGSSTLEFNESYEKIEVNYRKEWVVY